MRELRVRVNLGELPTIMTKYDRYLFIQVHSFIISSRFIMLSIYTMCLLLLAARIQTRIGLFYVRFCIAYRTAFATKIELSGRCSQNDGASIREQDDERWLPRRFHTRSFLMKWIYIFIHSVHFVQNSFRTWNTRCSNYDSWDTVTGDI